jgi:hypothetical protein
MRTKLGLTVGERTLAALGMIEGVAVADEVGEFDRL